MQTKCRIKTKNKIDKKICRIKIMCNMQTICRELEAQQNSKVVKNNYKI